MERRREGSGTRDSVGEKVEANESGEEQKGERRVQLPRVTANTCRNLSCASILSESSVCANT